MMKKRLLRMMALPALLLCLCGAAAAEENNEEAPGWKITDSAEITEDARAAFDSVKTELTDAAYEPVALLGEQQDVFCILCRATSDYEGAEPYYTLVYAGKNGIEVACGGGKTLLITEVQPAGKKRMTAAAFLLGHPIKADE